MAWHLFHGLFHGLKLGYKVDNRDGDSMKISTFAINMVRFIHLSWIRDE